MLPPGQKRMIRRREEEGCGNKYGEPGGKFKEGKEKKKKIKKVPQGTTPSQV